MMTEGRDNQAEETVSAKTLRLDWRTTFRDLGQAWWLEQNKQGDWHEMKPGRQRKKERGEKGGGKREREKGHGEGTAEPG